MTVTGSEVSWSEPDTSPERVDAALRDMLRARHAADHALAPARVINLVVIADFDRKPEISDRLAQVGRYHPSRTILCAVQPGRQTISATAAMQAQERPQGEIGVLREQVELDIGPGHLAHLQTIIDPVLVSELPTVLWSPDGHDDAIGALLGLADVVLIDTDELAQRIGAGPGIDRAAELGVHAYVVDLAWVRTTPWRERLAASFHDSLRREELARLDQLTIRHSRASPVSAPLLAGWLCARLGWTPGRASEISGTLRAVASDNRDGGNREVQIELEPVDLEVPGIAGVTVCRGNEFRLSLDRGQGGLTAGEHATGRPDQEWQVLGASRGEGGIFGEGLRQALLRDPTYAPALAAARSLVP